ncbi:MAG: hypothetical protein HP492_16670 [Nitrospira sp.]|nr:hypothetical protein [Nitrospira sp.]
MRVTLDQEQWEVRVGATIGDVLADISDRAQARSRIVTSLRLDQRTITDRDLDARFLREASGKFARLTAVSQSIRDLVESATQSAARYARDLSQDGYGVASAFRAGLSQMGALDLWLGKLADYLELVEGGQASRRTGDSERPLSAWVRELLEARAGRDIVLMADLLEYEILPRLQSGGSCDDQRRHV